MSQAYRPIVRMIRSSRLLLVMLGVAAAFHVWGIVRELPFAPDVDEPFLVLPAIRIAATGDMNPHWFGHPGSTIIYPLAFLYRLHHVVVDRDPAIAAELTPAAPPHNPSGYYLAGRLLSVAYALAAIPLIYLFGKRVFNARVALVGVWFACLVPLTVSHAQLVRTDAATVFFTLLSLMLVDRLLDAPTVGRHALAGAAVGLAIATKYTLGILLLALLAIDAALLVRDKAMPRASIVGAAAGLVAAGLVFAASTPYLFLDHSTALAYIRAEGETVHPGADGLSVLGNLVWYLSTALPSTLSAPLALLALAGMATALVRGQPRQRILAIFVCVFLVLISSSALHWQRWLIPLVSITCLFAAAVVVAGAKKLHCRARLHLRHVTTGRVLAAMVAVLSIQPVSELISDHIQLSAESTRIMARAWILENLPDHAQVVQEAYAAPLSVADFNGYVGDEAERIDSAVPRGDITVLDRRVLAHGRALRDYYERGYDYVVVSSDMYERFFRERERFSREVAFYEELFSRHRLVYGIGPTPTRGGPSIGVYRLNFSG